MYTEKSVAEGLFNMGRRKSEGSKRLGELIKTLRKRAGMSQQALATRLGVSYQQIQKYEYGRCELSLSRAISMAEALGAPIETLVRELAGGYPMGSYLDADELRALDFYRKHRHMSIGDLVSSLNCGI